MTRDNAVWLAWLLFFIVYEAKALIVGGETLSATWAWFRSEMPWPVAVFSSAVLGAVFLWLMSVHWLFDSLDRPGFDAVEKIVVIVGALLGGLGGALAVRKKNGRSDDSQTD